MSVAVHDGAATRMATAGYPDAVRSSASLLGLSPAGAALVAEAWRIGVEVARPTAPAVDRDARFPQESIDALRAAGLWGAYVPTDLGGKGASLADLAGVCLALGQHCGSTAMVYAMHQIQVACLVRHGRGVPVFEQEMRNIVAPGHVLASATTEAGIGGDVRNSICSVERSGDRFTLRKETPVISYGEHCDTILVTARRSADAPSSDQVIVMTRKADLDLEVTGTWDTFGMRGTCSLPFRLKATGDAAQILPEPYAVISARTMLPVTHIVWAALWLGIATDAVTIARSYLRAGARKQPGVVPPIASDVAALHAGLETAHGSLASVVRFEAEAWADPELAGRPNTTLRFNALKTQMSEACVELVSGALKVCGIAGYKNDTLYSLGRHLRDAHSGALMVHNDRILANSGALLCISKED